VALPVKVQPEKASAAYKNGILDIRIPMAANQPQRRIPIVIN
jgi:HSP20 family protein